MFLRALVILPLLLRLIPLVSADSRSEVAAVLDRLHEAADRADAKNYFNCFHANAVYIGTDADERWTMPEFKAFVMTYFEKGKGWRYLPTQRHIDMDSSGQFAWFDELLDNPKYGQARSSGALLKTTQGWKIVQYHLTFPIPNELALEITNKIKDSKY